MKSEISLSGDDVVVVPGVAGGIWRKVFDMLSEFWVFFPPYSLPPLLAFTLGVGFCASCCLCGVYYCLIVDERSFPVHFLLLCVGFYLLSLWLCRSFCRVFFSFTTMLSVVASHWLFPFWKSCIHVQGKDCLIEWSFKRMCILLLCLLLVSFFLAIISRRSSIYHNLMALLSYDYLGLSWWYHILNLSSTT